MLKPPDMSETTDALACLPAVATIGQRSLEEALFSRRSIRHFARLPITLSAISQLAWAATGATAYGCRTIPSAGALYPLVVYVVAGNVEGLGAGVYRYHVAGHVLERTLSRDCRVSLCAAALGQDFIREAPASLVIAAAYTRTSEKYGSRGARYVLMEAGHAGQNVYLQAAALGLGTVAVGAFEDEQVQQVLRLSKETHPLYIMPAGSPI